MHELESKLSEIKLDWTTKHVNDIETNPVNCWWTIGKYGRFERYYEIRQKPRCNKYGLVLDDNGYFCLYESIGSDPRDASLVAIYDTLDDAKDRARLQLFQIENISQCLSAYFHAD